MAAATKATALAVVADMAAALAAKAPVAVVAVVAADVDAAAPVATADRLGVKTQQKSPFQGLFFDLGTGPRAHRLYFMSTP